MNQKELARLAGVSQSTLSKAFSNSHEINPETRNHIFQVAKENGMFDKYNKGKIDKHVIGIIYPEFKSSFYKQILQLLEENLNNRNIIFISSASDFSPSREQELFIYYAFYCKVDGLIMLEPSINIKNNSFLPVIGINVHNTEIYNVLIDNTFAVNQVVSELYKKGHRKIGFAGDEITEFNKNLFLDAIQKQGLPIYSEQIKISKKRFEEAGVDCVEQWLKDKNLPTAIFAAYDEIAVGIYRALQFNGFQIPKDVSVCGMNEIAESPFLFPSLSTIRPKLKEICNSVVDLILKKIENQFYTPRNQIVFSSDFISRESIGIAPQR